MSTGFRLPKYKTLPQLEFDALMGRHDSDILFVNKFARSPDIDSNNTEDVWAAGGTLSYLTMAEAIDITSSSAADTSAGTGARTVKIYGVDNSGDLISETITMDGTSAVTTTNNYLQIYRAKVATAGSGRTNAGNITLSAGISAATQAYIEAGRSDTQISHFYIPNGFTGLMNRILRSVYRSPGTTGTKSGEISIETRDVNGVDHISNTVGLSSTGSNVNESDIDYPLVLNSHTRLKFIFTPETNNTACSVLYTLILVRDNFTDHYSAV